MIFGLTVAGLAALALIAPLCGRLVVRRRRWRRRAADVASRPEVTVPAGRAGGIEGRISARDVAWAHAAWQELRDDLIDYGPATSRASHRGRWRPGRAAS